MINKREFLKIMSLLPLAPTAFIGKLTKQIQPPLNILALKEMAEFIKNVSQDDWNKHCTHNHIIFNWYNPEEDHVEIRIFYNNNIILKKWLCTGYRLPGTCHIKNKNVAQYKFLIPKNEVKDFYFSRSYNMLNLIIANKYGIDLWAAEKMFNCTLSQKELSDFILDHVNDMEAQYEVFRCAGMTTYPVQIGSVTKEFMLSY